MSHGTEQSAAIEPVRDAMSLAYLIDGLQYFEFAKLQSAQVLRSVGF